MSDNTQNGILECLRMMLMPIARFCLRRSISIQDITECTKIALIEAAKEQLEEQGYKVNVSRISVATGLRRREVTRIYREGEVKNLIPGIVTRVIGRWQQDKKFQTKKGTPRVLSCEGEDCEFNELVRSISSDIHPGTAFFELQRLDAIEITPRGVKLVAAGYVPADQPKEIFALLARDVSNLIYAVEDNATMERKTPNLHATTLYDNISEEDVPIIEKWLLKEGSALHKKARKFLAKYDLDVNPKKNKKGGYTAVISAFSRLSKTSEE